MGVDREIPQRELRNNVGGVLREVEAGASLRVTVRGRPVADIVPIDGAPGWARAADVLAVTRSAPLDPEFQRDVEAVAGWKVDEL